MITAPIIEMIMIIQQNPESYLIVTRIPLHAIVMDCL